MKKLAFIMAVVMMFAFSAGVSMAAGKVAPKVAHKTVTMAKVVSMSGEVVKINYNNDRIIIKAGDKEYNLKTQAKLLAGIEKGEKVNFEMSGRTLKSISKM